MAHRLTPSTLVLLAFAFGCGGSQPAAEAPAPAPPPPPEPVAAIEPKPEPPPPADPPPPTPVFRVTEGVATPESVLYDAAADRYLVSNINGTPVATDNNGYIMELLPDGTVTKPKLVEGGAGKTKLDAPKGMGLVGNVLYVSDITVVRKFDAKTGAPKGDIVVKDAVFLNDIAVAPDGRIFVSDTGVKLGESGLEPAGGDAVYVIDKAGKVKALAKGPDLHGPNGILFDGTRLLVNTFGAAEVYHLDAEGKKVDVTTIPVGGLDGLGQLGDMLLVSSWGGKAIYRGKLGGTFEPVLSGLQGAADFAVDAKRSRVIVPRFLDHAVEAYEVN
jgi:hypothetical protein